MAQGFDVKGMRKQVNARDSVFLRSVVFRGKIIEKNLNIFNKFFILHMSYYII